MAKNIAIVGANPYSGNRGLGALTYSTMYLIYLVTKNINCDFKIYIIAHNPTNSCNQSKFKIGDMEISVQFLDKINIFTLSGLIKCLLKPKNLIRSLKLNYILDLGEGDSFSDIYGKARFKSINTPKMVFSLLRKKQILLPQTIGPFSDPKIVKQACRSIEKFSIVLARDSQSYEFVRKNTRQRNAYEIIDVAFFMPYKRISFNKNNIHVGLNISALLWYGGYNRKNQFRLATNYQQTIERIIEYFLQQHEVSLHLVPHVVGLNDDIENDYAISQQLVKKFANEKLLLAPFFLTPQDAKSYISGFDFFIGARMHSCIAAFSTNVPLYPMAYSRKFNGLFSDTLRYEYLGDMQRLRDDEILAGVKDAFFRRNDLKSIIIDRMNSVVEERYQLMTKILREFLEK